jgi:hypothetical protein
MADLGIPQKLIRLVKCTMEDKYSAVRIEKETSRRFQVKNGLRQGDALACLLFNIALEKVIRDAGILRILRHGTVLSHSIQIIQFDDDKDLVSRTLHNL